MTLVTGIALYFIIWWTVLFAVLPWGSHPPEQPEPGMAESAPARPRLGLKFLATTLVAGIIWLIFYGVVTFEVISFRDLFE